MVLSGQTVRSRIGPVRVQGLLTILRNLVQALDLKIALVRLQPGRRLHTVLDCRTRRNEALLTVPVFAVVQTVTGGSPTRVLRMLRNRVLRWLVIHFRYTCSDNLIALVFVLTQSEGGLGDNGGFSL